MWLAPGKMLLAIYGDAVSNAFQEQPLVVAKTLDIGQFGLDWNGSPAYLHGLLWRTPPLLWLGVILAGLSFFARGRNAWSSLEKYVIVYLVFVALLFIFMFGVASGRNSPHYILSSYVSLEVVAALGLVYALDWLAAKVRAARGRIVRNVILAAALIAAAASAIPYYPYYFTYYNPIMALIEKGQNPNYGYGEGLDLAARYLAQKPNARELTVMAWYSRGVVSYYFPGKNKYIFISQLVDEKVVNDIRTSDYLVTYYAVQKRRDIPAKLLAALEAIPPEHVIWMNGIEYVRIYRVADLPESFYAALEQ
jgi:hypothetical protein